MHATWVQKSLANATWDPFGTKSRPGPLPGAPTPKNYYSQIDLLHGNMSLQGRIVALIWELKWLQKRDFDARLALGPSKNEFLGVVLENVRNLMKFLCENA